MNMFRKKESGQLQCVKGCYIHSVKQIMVGDEIKHNKVIYTCDVAY